MKKVKNAKELLKGNRLDKTKVINKKLRPSFTLASYEDKLVILGDNHATLYYFFIESNKTEKLNITS